MQSIEERMKKGEFLGALAPYGYRKDPDDVHHLIIDEESARVVSDIYNWYTVDRWYMSEITGKLNDLEIPSPYMLKRLSRGDLPVKRDRSPNLWSATTVRSILRNQVYLGHMVQGRFLKKNTQHVERCIHPEDEWIIVKNTHNPIINQETFDLAKTRLEENRRYNSEGTDDNEFAGFLRCPDCGLAMARWGHSYSKSRGFQCSTYRDRSKTACTRHAIRIDDLRAAVLDAVKTQIKMAMSFYSIFDELCASSKIQDEIKRLSSEIRLSEDKYDKAINNKASIYIDYRSGKLEKHEYDIKKAALDKQINDLEATLDALRKDRETVSGGMDFAQANLGVFLKYQSLTQLDRAVLLDLVDVIHIFEGGKVEVAFLLKKEIKAVMDFIERFI